MKPTIHIPVLSHEVLKWLQPALGQTMVDGTLGGGGHARLLAAAVGDSGRVVGVDRDPKAIARAEVALQGLPLMIATASYCDIPEVLTESGFDAVDGILLDLGLSSDQLVDDERGFSFDSTGPLDLRFDPTRGKPASQFLERITPERLADIIYKYGEERFSRRIARAICDRQRERPIESAQDLASIVRRSVPHPKRYRNSKPIDTATRTFQALRIAVNEELRQLEIALGRLPDCLAAGGRIAIISFHSLEDRIVKNAFRDDDRLSALTRKPITASDEEIADNARSRSAKLRVAERMG